MEREEIIVLDKGVSLDELADEMPCCRPMPQALK